MYAIFKNTFPITKCRKTTNKKGFKGKINHSIKAQVIITTIKLYWAVIIVAMETSFNESLLTVFGQVACCIRRMEIRVYSTVQTYPSALLWKAFAAPAAVSSSTLATVLLSTLSDTKTDMIVRAGRGEVSRQTPHKHRTPAFRNVHLVCTNTDMHWMHVLVLQCMLGHCGWRTVSVCDQLWSVIHLFMQPAVAHERGELWHSCIYCCGLQKGSFGCGRTESQSEDPVL